MECYYCLKFKASGHLCLCRTKDISLCSVLDLQASALQRLACHCKATRFHRWSGCLSPPKNISALEKLFLSP